MHVCNKRGAFEQLGGRLPILLSMITIYSTIKHLIDGERLNKFATTRKLGNKNDCDDYNNRILLQLVCMVRIFRFK